MFRIGIVGCGGIAQVHAAVLEQLDETTLIACADIRPERAEKMAEKYHCHAYSSLEDMLENEKLDAVHICTPHALHVPMAKKIAEKGIAVFTEKPPVVSREQWDELAAVAEKTRLGICFQNRYNPNVREAKRLIEENVYGDLLGARASVCWKRTEPYYTDSGWRGTWELEGGGALINQSIHTLDLLIYLMGKADHVEAHMANHHLKGTIEVEDTVEAYLLLQGKPALFYATTAYVCDAPVMVEITLEKATLRLEGDVLEIRTAQGIERKNFPLPQILGKDYWGHGHAVCIGDFYDSLKNNRPYQNDLASVADLADAMLKIYEQGKPFLS